MMLDEIRRKLEMVGLADPQIISPALATPLERLPVESLDNPVIASGLGEQIPQIEPMQQNTDPNSPPYFQRFPVQDDAPPNYSQQIANKIAEPTNNSAITANRSMSQRIADKIAEINNKDYSKPVRDNQGNLIKPAGKDRKKKWSTLEKIGSALAGFAQGGIPGAIMGATDRNYFKKMQDALKKAELLPQFEQAAQMEQFQSQQESQAAQRENIKADNEYNQAVLQDRSEGRTAKMQQDSLKKLTGLKYYDPNNIAHKKLAEQAGLNTEALQGWDDRKRDRKQVAGQWFIEKTPNSGIYEQADIPIDESKTMVDYVVEMPPDSLGKREKRTYRVAQKDAANFSTQMSALGARLEQAESQFSRRLALDEKKFTQAKGEFERVIRLRQQQFDALQQARAQGNANAERDYQLKLDQYDAMLEKMLTASRSAFDLDDDQKADIEKFVRSKRP